MKRNPHIVKLEFLAVTGVVLGVIVTLLGVFNYQIGILLPVGIVILAAGILSWLLAITAAAITHGD